ncbi:YjfB family protein [Viridibacillus arvi]|uniref:YjfB family protein n=1 Tax=Viridibacillus arvi TaxID=263475 RepID=UPI0036B7937F
MDINSMMSMDLAQLQQTVQMSVLQNSMNMQAIAAVQLLEAMPEPVQAAHPYKGATIDIQV